MNSFITLEPGVGVWSSLWDSVEARRSLGLGQDPWVQGGEKRSRRRGWVEAASAAQARGVGLWTHVGGEQETDRAAGTCDD